MTYETDKRNYPVPDDDQSPWDDDYQEAMALLDADISTLFSSRVATDTFNDHTSVFNSHVGTSDAHHAQTQSSDIDHRQVTNVQASQHHAKTTSGDLEDGGSDELNVGGLAGQLVDSQPPLEHGNGSHSTNYASQSHDHSGGTVGSSTNPVTNTYVDTADHSSTNTESLSVTDILNVTPKSTVPSSPSENDVYLDNGTNTSDGTVGFRYYDGSAWSDL